MSKGDLKLNPQRVSYHVNDGVQLVGDAWGASDAAPLGQDEYKEDANGLDLSPAIVSTRLPPVERRESVRAVARSG